MMSVKYGWLVLVIFLLCGCIYATSFDSGMEQYAVLFGPESWANDTGWSPEQLKETTVPMWDSLSSSARTEIGRLSIGSTARVLKDSVKGYQVVDPETAVVGWISKIYVKDIVVGDAAGVSRKPAEKKGTGHVPLAEKKACVVAVPAKDRVPAAPTKTLAQKPVPVRNARDVSVAPVAEAAKKSSQPRREVKVVKVQ